SSLGWRSVHMTKKPSRLSLVAIIAGIAAAAAKPSGAVTLAPEKPSQVVQLVSGATDPLCIGVSAVKTIVNPDGTTGSFSIPPGQVLVVTQLHAENLSGSGTPGNLIVFSVTNGNTAAEL